MQAIIMAAGKGSRLGKLTEETPKSLLEIKGRKLLDINISLLHKYGIWDITIVTGFQDKKIMEAVADIPGVECVYNPFYDFTNVIGSFYMGMGKLHDDFIYLHADTIYDPVILEELLTDSGDIVLPVDSKPCDDEAMKVRVDNGKVVEITKEMDNTVAAGEFIGVAKIKKNVINDLQKYTTEILRNKVYSSYFEGAIQMVLDTHRYNVKMIDTNGKFWGEVDFEEDYNRASKNICDELIQL
jgi:choline kinase